MTIQRWDYHGVNELLGHYSGEWVTDEDCHAVEQERDILRTERDDARAEIAWLREHWTAPDAQAQPAPARDPLFEEAKAFLLSHEEATHIELWNHLRRWNIDPAHAKELMAAVREGEGA